VRKKIWHYRPNYLKKSPPKNHPNHQKPPIRPKNFRPFGPIFFHVFFILKPRLIGIHLLLSRVTKYISGAWAVKNQEIFPGGIFLEYFWGRCFGAPGTPSPCVHLWDGDVEKVFISILRGLTHTPPPHAEKGMKKRNPRNPFQLRTGKFWGLFLFFCQFGQILETPRRKVLNMYENAFET